MLFQSPLYLPLLATCLAVFWLLLKRTDLRVIFLTVASIALLIAMQSSAGRRAAAGKELLGALLLAIVVFALGRVLRARRSTALMLVSLGLPLAVLVYFKYLSRWIPSLALGIAIPVGVSYYTFKHVSYLVECRRGRFADATMSTYLAYVFFFPMFTAGPIERFTNFAPQATKIAWSPQDVAPAIERILIGLGKKFLLVNLLLEPLLPPGDLIAGGAPTLQGHQILAGCFIRLLVTYFDFSGYTDMVLGTGRLFSFRLIENFNFPLLRPNLAEFWRTWHISLSSWARDYVYLPLLGRYRNTDLALLATMLTIGVWHGAQPGWALWGLHHGVGLALYGRYKRWADDRPAVSRFRVTIGWRVVATVLVWGYVSLGYALTFDPTTFGSSLRLYVKALRLGVWG